MAPKLHTMIPYICEFSIWNLLHVTIPAPGILKCFVYLEKIVNRCQETIFLISILVYVPQITSKVKCHICLCICHKETNDNTSCRSTDVFSPTLYGDERSFSRLECFTSGTHRIGDLREGLDVSKKRQMSSL